jgi:hypothetical protein
VVHGMSRILHSLLGLLDKPTGGMIKPPHRRVSEHGKGRWAISNEVY